MIIFSFVETLGASDDSAGVAVVVVDFDKSWLFNPGESFRVAFVKPHIGGSVDSSTTTVVSIPIHVMRQQ